MPQTPEPADVETIWTRYLACRHPLLRNELVEHYRGLIGRAIATLWIPWTLQREDLLGAGQIGLITAVMRYDPAKGSFEGYALWRIRGAMLDELRNTGPIPRMAMARSKRINAARDELRGELMREPEHDEVQARLGVDIEEYMRMRNDSDLMETYAAGDLANGTQSIEQHGRHREPEADATAKNDDDVSKWIGCLPPLYRMIVRMYAVDGLTRQEIGRSIGYSAARIGQLYREGIAYLREKYDDQKAH
jgi:RNA polymerase sigma factor FliA